MGMLSYMQNDTNIDKNASGAGSSVITVTPRPIIPCYYCDSEQYGIIRFLNAAVGYPPFLIFINDQLAVSGLDNGVLSQYGRVSAHLQEVSVKGQNDYVYLKKTINVPINGAITVAIINTDSGPDLTVIAEIYCNGGINTGCFRVCNLSITNREVNVFFNDGSVMFRDVTYKDVTSFQYPATGYYMVTVSDSSGYTGNILLSANIYVRGNAAYTLYIYNRNNIPDAIRILIVEDRKI